MDLLYLVRIDEPLWQKCLHVNEFVDYSLMQFRSPTFLVLFQALLQILPGNTAWSSVTTSHV